MLVLACLWFCFSCSPRFCRVKTQEGPPPNHCTRSTDDSPPSPRARALSTRVSPGNERTKTLSNARAPLIRLPSVASPVVASRERSSERCPRKCGVRVSPAPSEKCVFATRRTTRGFPRSGNPAERKRRNSSRVCLSRASRSRVASSTAPTRGSREESARSQSFPRRRVPDPAEREGVSPTPLRKEASSSSEAVAARRKSGNFIFDPLGSFSVHERSIRDLNKRSKFQSNLAMDDHATRGPRTRAGTPREVGRSVGRAGEF